MKLFQERRRPLRFGGDEADTTVSAEGAYKAKQSTTPPWRGGTLLFVGGHHTSAIAVIEALVEKRRVSVSDIYWIGHKYSMWGDKNPGAEYREVTALGIPFNDLKAGKLYRTFHPLKLIRIPFGFLQAFYFLLKIKPNLIVSFGGYLAVPVVMVGWLLRIPAVTCEQTVVSGWANRVVAKFARKIFVAWPQSEKFFPKSKVAVTGLPLRQEVLKPQGLPVASDLGQFLKAAKKAKKPVIYITGGKQGSHTINKAVEGVLGELLREYSVVHQCGSSSVADDYGGLKAYRLQLTAELRPHYLVQEYFNAAEVGAIYRAEPTRCTSSPLWVSRLCLFPSLGFPIMSRSGMLGFWPISARQESCLKKS